jgi:Arc/MetJ-type ribon-helix-helix transcriptional regulator
MMTVVRTTVNIEEQLLVRAKQLAAGSRRSLSEVVNDALRLLLARDPARRQGQVDLPVFGGSGLRPGVDLEDKDALAELLDAPADDQAGARAAD